MATYLTAKELANAAGYTYQQIYNINKVLPDNQKLLVQGGDGKKYDLAIFVQRWVDYNIGKIRGSDDEEDDSDLKAAKTRHEKIKTEKTRLEVARMRAELVDVQDVRRLWGDVLKNATQALLQLPNTLSLTLQGLDSREAIKQTIEHDLRQALAQLAETPLPSYVTTAESIQEEMSDDE